MNDTLVSLAGQASSARPFVGHMSREQYESAYFALSGCAFSWQEPLQDDVLLEILPALRAYVKVAERLDLPD